MPSEAATRADIERLYDKLEPMAIDIAVIKTKMEDLPPPRPCGYLTDLKHEVDNHLGDASDTKKSLKKSVISALVGVAKMAIIFLIASWVLSLQGCTNYRARIEIPVTVMDTDGNPIIGPDGIPIVKTKVASIDMFYFVQDKTFKRFEIDPETNKVIIENFGSKMSQAIEAAVNKIP